MPPDGRSRRQTFQFTPLREGRHERVRVTEYHYEISIHAPPRGATMFMGMAAPRRSNFNSRPSARGDGRVVFLSFVAFHFNSRPSARGDGVPASLAAQRRRISIHAPPRGATFTAPTVNGRIAIFQFTPLREGRPRAPARQAACTLFQFTPLREGRQGLSVPYHTSTSISIHAPPRGATHRAPDSGRLAGHFNSRPSARGDVRAASRGRGLCISIHAPPRGATFVAFRQRLPCKFQFTPLREGRRQKICNFCKSFVQPLQISMA